MKYKKQIDKSRYVFGKYVHKPRWISYWHQIDEILSKEDASSVLDIGPGTDFLKVMLELWKPEMNYKTLDVAGDVKPDIVGSVTEIPLEDRSFDIVSAFQVLEHIQFSDFENALMEMKRVSKKYVIISLPHKSPTVEVHFRAPLTPRVQKAIKIPFPREHQFDGQHYWEVGKKGYSPSKILNILKKHFIVEEDYIPFENQYHHFYVLTKRTNQ